VECTLFCLRNKLIIDKIGISVFKQGINLEDIRFANPDLPKDKIQISVFKQQLPSHNSKGQGIKRVFHRHPMNADQLMDDELFYFLCILSWNWHRKTDPYFCHLGEYGHKILDIFCFIFLLLVFICILYYLGKGLSSYL
jgi:hypothetical protein